MQPVLKVTGMEGGYGNVQILNGIDLHVNQGEFVTIIGPNGCCLLYTSDAADE